MSVRRTSVRRTSGRRVATFVVGALSVWLGTWACSQTPTGATTPFSLTFDGFPTPSVVLGDTLRDTTGAPVMARALVFNPSGDVIPNAAVRFVVVNATPLIRYDSISGFIVSTGSALGTAHVVASVGSLQSDLRTISIVPRPDTVLAGFVPDDTLRYSFVDTTLNYSVALQLFVRHRDGTTFTGVGSYLVHYTLENAADTVVATLVDDQRRRLKSDPTGRTQIDTTSSDGSAARKLYLRPSERLARPVDSIVVLATVQYRRSTVSGSPVRFVIPVKPKAGAVGQFR